MITAIFKKDYSDYSVDTQSLESAFNNLRNQGRHFCDALINFKNRRSKYVAIIFKGRAGDVADTSMFYLWAGNNLREDVVSA